MGTEYNLAIAHERSNAFMSDRLILPTTNKCYYSNTTNYTRILETISSTEIVRIASSYPATFLFPYTEVGNFGYKFLSETKAFSIGWLKGEKPE
jgi:hypothetical protein